MEDPPPKPKSRSLRIFARVVSLFTHPGIMPCWIIFLWFPWSGPFLQLQLFTLFFLALLPVIASYIYFKAQKIEDLFKIEQRHRIFPFFFNLGGIAIFTLGNMLLMDEIIPMKFIVILLLFNVIGLLITLYWKISLHMMGVSAMIGGAIALGVLPEQAELLVIGLGLSGLVAWARWYLRSHGWAQLVGGTALGFFGAWILVWGL